ncbi:GMC oxidoreductase [Lewinella sp. W8]|uniref:GMC oxidoreductase n=1 Tax=Lewinella sp. W8 TaxID=2528208 RepID=UPI0010675BDF|nr:GMC family oxidoreductase [Lewinella sp. W8]MTB52996.1 GMC family oxidoreductase [Lewinella sp. W8]
MQTRPQTYDAIVVGSGISGGWAAKELCEGGLKVLLLDRGRHVEHRKDYPTAEKDPWHFPLKGYLTAEERLQHPGHPAAKKDRLHFVASEVEHPYEQERPFRWLRGYQLGGRSLIWGRHSYRWSDLDFRANQEDGHGVDWPIRYRDLEKWYGYVERFAGISGDRRGLPQLPDGEFLPPFPLNCAEQWVSDRIQERWPERMIIPGRVANATTALPGRMPCQVRNRCDRGCPYGGYFSTQSSTLPAAMATGNLTVRTDSIVSEVAYDPDRERATGVRVIDRLTKEEHQYRARIIFLNASTIGTTAILLNSRSARFPDGLGNDSGELGHNLMDHIMGGGAGGRVPGMEDQYYRGRKPNGIYFPRFRNVSPATRTDKFLRGYGYQGGAGRSGWQRGQSSFAFGAEFKTSLLEPGSWGIGIGGFGECLPHHDNRMYLHPEKKDAWGMPLVVFDARFRDNELAMCRDMAETAAEMLEAAGVEDVSMNHNPSRFGSSIHEMGTARMGRDPETSVLNAFNQIHAVPNVFVTDGACMTSSACQNPSLTYMALTARAAAYAREQLKQGKL